MHKYGWADLRLAKQTKELINKSEFEKEFGGKKTKT